MIWRMLVVDALCEFVEVEIFWRMLVVDALYGLVYEVEDADVALIAVVDGAYAFVHVSHMLMHVLGDVSFFFGFLLFLFSCALIALS